MSAPAPRERRRHALTIGLCLGIGALLILGGASSLGASPVFGVVVIAVGALFVLGGVALIRHVRRRSPAGGAN